MFFESLETRRLQSATVSAELDGNATLNVSGSNQADLISVFEDSGSVSVFSGSDFLGNFTGVGAVHIDAKGGDDIITYTGNSLSALIEGNNGNDSMSISDPGAGSSTLYGGNGDDALTVLYGNHTRVHGGNGNDSITG